MKYQPVGTTAMILAAAFDIRRKNLLISIPGCVGAGCQEQTGELRTQGFERQQPVGKEYLASCFLESWCWYGYQRSVRASLRYRW